MDFLPKFPLPISNITLFAVILLAGLVAGRLVSHVSFLPKITGYVAIGVLLGQAGFGLVSPEMLVHSREFVHIALGLALFELGRNLDLKWMLHERWLLLTAGVEAGLSFVIVFGLLLMMGHPLLVSAAVAALGMATSPASTLLVARELGAEGQVTRRLLSLTATNNILALLAFVGVWPLLHFVHHTPPMRGVLHPLYLLGGSLILALLVYGLMLLLAGWVGKRRGSQFILLAAAVLLAIGSAQALQLPVVIVLLALGVMSRNLDTRYMLMRLEFGVAAEMFYVILFVLVGANMKFADWSALGAVIGIFLVARLIGKGLGVFLFAPRSGLTHKQAGMLSVALLPMAEPAMAVTLAVADLYPGFGDRMSEVLVGAVAVMNMFGPIATRLALKSVGEANPEKASEA